jgi:hypothetical protein
MQNNFLVEGAQKISQLGGDATFIYLTPEFRAKYPDQSANLWPAATPTSLAGLAETSPDDQVFHMSFKTIVLTAYTFANSDSVTGMAQSHARQGAEENEFYQLTKYLYSKFSGSGKTFILKNWEGDWTALGGPYAVADNISEGAVQDMIASLKVRQAGVTKAPPEANDSSMRVLNGAEVNRVLDYAQHGLTRVINAVVPEVNADMVTYSSYDSTTVGQDSRLKSSLRIRAAWAIAEFSSPSTACTKTSSPAGPPGARRPFSRPQARRGSTAHSCGIYTTTNVCSPTGNRLRWILRSEVRHAPPTQTAAGCGCGVRTGRPARRWRCSSSTGNNFRALAWRGILCGFIEVFAAQLLHRHRKPVQKRSWCSP